MTTVWHTARTPDEHPLTSRQADQLRTAVASVESGLEVIVERVARLRTAVASVEGGLEVIMEQVARLPTREEMWRAVVMGILGGAAITIVFALAFFSTEALAPGSQQKRANLREPQAFLTGGLRSTRTRPDR